ncbi:hypothetical protein SPAR28_0820 [Streptococcus pneumoniae GA13338]|nr:hypothetical protein SPAR28_0820 [Streptococcus pneumoniae GA13338]EHZ23661.1 hypothetical protein SPAR33_0919 [Streptococcus pneumoniae GA13723]
MNATDIKNTYLKYIKENAVFNDVTDTHTEVITPFIDPLGEAIGFSIKSNGKHLTVTDDGYTIWNLSINNIDVTKKGDVKTSLTHFSTLMDLIYTMEQSNGRLVKNI